MSASLGRFDLAVVGAGICGLAHALAAARRGLKVVVIDRDAQANGASIRNFGFVTVTGQQRGECWRRAMRSRDVWAEVAPRSRHPRRASRPRRGRPPAGGRGRARGVPGDRDGRGLRAAVGSARRRRASRCWRADDLQARLVEPARAAGRVARARFPRWPAGWPRRRASRSSTRRWSGGRAADASRPPAARFAAERCVVCPGDDFLALFPDRFARLRPDPLQAAHAARGAAPRAAPPHRRGHVRSRPGPLSGLRRAAGGRGAEAAARGRAARASGERRAPDRRCRARTARWSSATRTTTARRPTRSRPMAVDELILDEFRTVLALPEPAVGERWIGTYASAPDRLMLVDRPADRRAAGRDHQRHRRQHLLRHRRGGHRRPDGGELSEHGPSHSGT